MGPQRVGHNWAPECTHTHTHTQQYSVKEKEASKSRANQGRWIWETYDQPGILQWAHANENKLVSTSVCLILGVKMQAVRWCKIIEGRSWSHLGVGGWEFIPEASCCLFCLLLEDLRGSTQIPVMPASPCSCHFPYFSFCKIIFLLTSSGKTQRNLPDVY